MTRLAKLQEFLAADPSDSFTRYAIGLEYANARNFPEAIAALEALREHDPKYVPTYYMLASYYREIAEKQKAEEVYHAGIKVANSTGDRHAASELQAALDELEDEV